MSGKMPSGSRPYWDAKGNCYRDRRTGQFVCPPSGSKKRAPAGKPQPAGTDKQRPSKPQPKKPPQKPPQKPKRPGWFPMPDQRHLLRGEIARRPTKSTRDT
jgi:hypothetical protein